MSMILTYALSLMASVSSCDRGARLPVATPNCVITYDASWVHDVVTPYIKLRFGDQAGNLDLEHPGIVGGPNEYELIFHLKSPLLESYPDAPFVVLKANSCTRQVLDSHLAYSPGTGPR